MWLECIHNSDGFEKPAVEHHVKVGADVIELMALGRQLGGKSFEDFQ
jgi:hypothetical protein